MALPVNHNEEPIKKREKLLRHFDSIFRIFDSIKINDNTIVKVVYGWYFKDGNAIVVDKEGIEYEIYNNYTDTIAKIEKI